jgi:hypothetical protein
MSKIGTDKFHPVKPERMRRIYCNILNLRKISPSKRPFVSVAKNPLFIRFTGLLIFLFLSFGPASETGMSQYDDTLKLQPAASLINLDEGVVFEIFPHTGFMGKSGTFGLRLGMNYSAFNLELAGEQVIGKLANLYLLSVNAILNLSTRSRLIPYGAAGIGLLLTVPSSTIGDETVSSIGFNFGAGVRLYFTRTLGIRAEAKQYITNVKSNRDGREELMLFQEISLGATFMIR